MDELYDVINFEGKILLKPKQNYSSSMSSNAMSNYQLPGGLIVTFPPLPEEIKTNFP